MELIESSVVKLAEFIRRKKISAYELTQAYIHQIQKVNPKINAIVQFKPERALSEAKKLDEMQAKGASLGPLHGVPFTLKDVYNTKNDIVTAGTLGLKNNVATEDATITKRLKQAGAILLGKTNTPEFENAADTDNLIYGKTSNPYDFSRSAGGSSGGPAASVSACCSAFDIGADTGGSLRVPAHYCGLVTIRPTMRRIPSTGTVYGLRTAIMGMFSTEGPICRYVEDVNLLMSIIQGPDHIDPKTIPTFPITITNNKINEFKIAYFDDDGISRVTAETKTAIKNAVNSLTDSGAKLTQDQPKRLSEGLEIFKEVLGANIVESFQTALTQFNTPKASPLLEKLMKRLAPYTCDLPTFVKRWDHWERFQSDILAFFQNYDAIICPVTATEALPHTTPMWDPDQINKTSYCWTMSATLLPSAVVRAGTSKTGLPIGIQIITQPYREDIALMIAKEVESALGGWKKSTLI